MIIYGDGLYFSFEVISYEFSNTEFSDDANWLIVRVSAKSSEFEWSAVGPILRAHELEVLGEWLSLLSKEGKDSEISFTEGELSFAFTAERGKQFHVLLDFGFHPRGASYDYVNGEPYVISFYVSRDDLRSLSDSVNDMVKMHPVRVFK